MNTAYKSFSLLVIFILMAGCSEDQSTENTSQVLTPTFETIMAAEAFMPQDERLAKIYDRSCRTCHAFVDAEAPLTGFVAEWDIRLAKGMTTLVANTRHSVGGMPAMGTCLDCSDADFNALIDFMATATAIATEDAK